MARPDRENVWMQALRSRPVIIVIIVTIILIALAIFSPLIFNNPALADGYNFEKYSEIARSFGGYFGPFVALLAAFLTFMAFYIQFQANESIRLRFETQQANAHFYKMLDIHVKNVENLNMNSFRNNKKIRNIELKKNKTLIENNIKSFSTAINKIIEAPLDYDEVIIEYKKNHSGDSLELKPHKVAGGDVFNLILKDFNFTFYVVKHIVESKKNSFKLDDDQISKLSYLIFFWGTNSPNIKIKGINKKIIKTIDAYLHNIRKQFRANKGNKFTFVYKTENKDKQLSFRFIPFSGHSINLARYYRHLYQTVVHLYNCDDNDLITESELKTNLDTLRAQLSNEEQLLLYYNYRIGFGKNWDNLGKKDYKFLSEYRMIHNIPLYNSIPKGITNPEEHFEDFIIEKQKSDPNYRLFEWSS